MKRSHSYFIVLICCFLCNPLISEQKEMPNKEIERILDILKNAKEHSFDAPSKEDAITVLGVLKVKKAIPILIDEYKKSKRDSIKRLKISL